MALSWYWTYGARSLQYIHTYSDTSKVWTPPLVGHFHRPHRPLPGALLDVGCLFDAVKLLFLLHLPMAPRSELTSALCECICELLHWKHLEKLSATMPHRVEAIIGNQGWWCTHTRSHTMNSWRFERQDIMWWRRCGPMGVQTLVSLYMAIVEP